LALVRQIVKLSGGRLGVKTKQGEGSTFWVELPLGVGGNALNIQGKRILSPENLAGLQSSFESQSFGFKNNLATTVDVAAYEATIPPTLADPVRNVAQLQTPGKYELYGLKHKLKYYKSGHSAVRKT
jgi:hypothetical protein